MDYVQAFKARVNVVKSLDNMKSDADRFRAVIALNHHINGTTEPAAQAQLMVGIAALTFDFADNAQMKKIHAENGTKLMGLFNDNNTDPRMLGTFQHINKWINADAVAKKYYYQKSETGFFCPQEDGCVTAVFGTQKTVQPA